MDFEPGEEARELGALTGDLAASGRPLWPALAEAGILTASLQGYGLGAQAEVLTALGRHAATVPYLTSVVAAAATLQQFGAAGHAERAGQGSIIAIGVDGQVHGTQPAPDAVLVAAAEGLYLLGADAKIEPQEVPGGPGTGLLRAGLPAQPLIADPAATAWLRARLTVGAAAYQLGVVSRALEMTAAHARTRVQFGRPIGAFQAVSQRLADAWIDVEALRVAVAQAAWLLDSGRPARAEVATAGFWTAEAGHRVLHTAVHVHGGVGIDLDHPLHRFFLAAEYHEFLLGGATAQLLRIAEVF